MPISKLKQLEIANVAYANVTGQFAMFHNPKYRGPNFTWDTFADNIKRESDLWVIIHNIKGNRAENIQRMQEYAYEIAARLVKRMQE